MVDVFTGTKIIPGATPIRSISLREAMIEITRNAYISPDKISEWMTVIGSLPEGDEKQLLASGVLDRIARMCEVAIKFGVVEGWPGDDVPGTATAVGSLYVLSAAESMELAALFTTHLDPNADVLNDITFPPKPIL